MCRLQLSVFPNSRPRSRFLYIGEVNNAACSSFMEVINGQRLTMRPGLVEVDRVQFVRAEQTDVVGTLVAVPIARRTEQSTTSGDLINLTATRLHDNGNASTAQGREKLLSFLRLSVSESACFRSLWDSPRHTPRLVRRMYLIY